MALSRSDEEKKNAEDQVKEEVVEKKLSYLVLKLNPRLSADQMKTFI